LSPGAAGARAPSPSLFHQRDRVVPLLQFSRGSFPFIERIFTDTAYASDRVPNATCAASTSRTAAASRTVCGRRVRRLRG